MDPYHKCSTLSAYNELIMTVGDDYVCNFPPAASTKPHSLMCLHCLYCLWEYSLICCKCPLDRHNV